MDERNRRPRWSGAQKQRNEAEEIPEQLHCGSPGLVLGNENARPELFEANFRQALAEVLEQNGTGLGFWASLSA
jgi:hypothetical protein